MCVLQAKHRSQRFALVQIVRISESNALSVLEHFALTLESLWRHGKSGMSASEFDTKYLKAIAGDSARQSCTPGEAIGGSLAWLIERIAKSEIGPDCRGGDTAAARGHLQTRYRLPQRS
jgi:hypothetical protein